MVLWLTGLPCSGKTTLGHAVAKSLHALGATTEVLDGDVLRRDLWKDLGFTRADREENVRRIARLTQELESKGVVPVVSAVSPYRAGREDARAASLGFVEIFVNAPLAVCEERDVKGMYRKARLGEIHGFTGVDDPYEPPLHPQVECRTDLETVEESVAKILAAVAALKPA